MADMDKMMEILGPEAAGLLAEFLGKIEGKSMLELTPILMEFKKRLPDREFSQEEKSIIIEAALQSMPEGEQNRYKSMLKMFKIV